jgi:LPXTG-motif cell wall-anchored protein
VIPITVHFVRTESSREHPMFIFHVFSEYYLMILGLVLIVVGGFMKRKRRKAN